MTEGGSGRTREVARRALTRLRNAPYLPRWLVLGALIGIVAGLGAVAFLAMLEGGTYLLLHLVGGYTPATPAGEGGIHAASAFTRPWAIPLIAAAGMTIAALVVHYVAPEAEGHGGDAAIEAAHHRPTGLRFRAAIVKMVVSALTLGAGGSGGREGPTAQISATFGSVLARKLNLSPADARIAVAAGIASGIGSIFRAPLGGAILGAELPYRDDVDTDALVPSLVASIVGFATFSLFYGFDPIFGDLGSYRFEHVRDLAYFAILGIAAGAIGRVYITVFRRGGEWIRALRLPRFVKPVLAGFAVGGIGLAIPGVLGTGYGDVQQVMEQPVLVGMPLWVVLALPLAKIVATTLTVGSGGVGGIFGPGMVIGGVTGAAVWRLLDATSLPVPDSPVPFVIVGMITCFGSIAHAPLAVMLMVAEMTGNLAMLAPAMVSVALATLVVGHQSIYVAQLPNRAALPANRIAFGLPMAASVSVEEVMTTPRVIVDARGGAREVLAVLSEADLPGAPVVGADGRYVGSVERAQLAELAERGPDSPVGALADRQTVTLAADATLDSAIDAVVTSGSGWVPVLGADRAVVGIVAVPDVVRGYRLGLRQLARRLARPSVGASFGEYTVAAGSPADGATVESLGLPRSTIIVAVSRGAARLTVGGGTVLQADDVLSVIAGVGTADALEPLFAARP